jgi:alpha-N-arabinofuranosidase
VASLIAHTMGVQRAYGASFLHALVVVCALCWALSSRCAEGQNPNGQLSVDASPQNARKIPDKMFGIFFEV